MADGLLRPVLQAFDIQQQASSDAALASFSGIVFIILAFAVLIYVYSSFALMTIAKKTNTQNPWLAWIPIANVYLMTQIAGVSGWFTLGILLGIIPVIGSLVVTAGGVYLWWKIAEARQKSGALSLLMLVPGANLIVMGILAWSD